MQLVGNKYFPIRNELIQSVKPLTETADGDAALVLTSLMSIITILPYSMEQLVDVENCMTSVERIVEYGALKPEAYLDNTDGQLVHELGGKLELEHVWLRYAEEEKYVLKDISFTIYTKEKVILISILFAYLQFVYCVTDRSCWENWCREIFTYHCPLSLGRARGIHSTQWNQYIATSITQS